MKKKDYIETCWNEIEKPKRRHPKKTLKHESKKPSALTVIVIYVSITLYLILYLTIYRQGLL